MAEPVERYVDLPLGLVDAADIAPPSGAPTGYAATTRPPQWTSPVDADRIGWMFADTSRVDPLRRSGGSGARPWSVAGVDEAAFVGEDHSLDSVAETQLGEDAGDVGFDRWPAEV